MDFKEYKQLFTEKAKKEKRDSHYINLCLSYAEKLYNQQVPVIYDIKHLSLLVGVKEDYVRRAITYTNKYYWNFHIPKLNGGKRTINEPLPLLKDIQLWILHHILEKQETHPCAKAYVPHRKLKENAKFHTRQKIVISFDVQNFFPSIDLDAISKIFINIGYSKKNSYLLAKLCCLNNELPQGAPTSPYLSNLYMFSFDDNVMRYCREKGIIYTRYADDITFSSKSDINIKALTEFVKLELSNKKLSLNQDKSKVMYKSDAQIVTGVVVNERMRLPKKKRQELRQEMYYVITRGLENHINFIKCNKKNYLKHLAGKIMYALYLEPSNTEFQDYYTFLQRLMDPNYKRKKKKLALDPNIILNEVLIEQLSENYITCIKKDNSIQRVGSLELHYGLNLCHANSLLFAIMLKEQYPTVKVNISEGIVVLTNGFAYTHFWIHVVQNNKEEFCDVTRDCFEKKILQAKERRYYKVTDLTIDEMEQRLASDNIFLDSKEYLSLYYKKYPKFSEVYDGLNNKLSD